jgi:hypothetical protein
MTALSYLIQAAPSIRGQNRTAHPVQWLSGMNDTARPAASTTVPTLAALQEFTYGVELETIGLTRLQLATLVAGVTGGRVVVRGGGYDKHAVVLPDGREWMCMTDASLSGGRFGHCGEVVTPIMTYADMPMLQSVCRALADAGARVDHSCGVHVHVGADALDTAALTRLAKLVYQQEPLMVEALGVASQRLGTYCRPVEDSMIGRLVSRRPATKQALARAWYNGDESYAQRDHYHGSRYHGLNLHSVFFRGTVEFRYFEGTLHAGKVKAYVQLCLALAAKAKAGKAAVARKRAFSRQTAKYDFRVFLLRLGMIGDEFKTARLHLLARLAGSSSWKNGKPAPAPKADAAATATAVEV